MFVNFINSSSMISFLMSSDIVFLIFNIISIITYGSYITIKGDQTRALGKVFSGIVLYCFIIFMVEYYNLSNKWLQNLNYNILDSTIIYSGYNYDFVMPTFLWLMCFFSLIYLVVLFLNHKNLKTKP